ncbi:MAG: COP23 domain-containing protein [Leptodesmis sp.]|uniref:COP23 domain-containing protein n=1 Tax=Leptodesmis sp. TaxID=3100501 RepID=UPI003D14304E
MSHQPLSAKSGILMPPIRCLSRATGITFSVLLLLGSTAASALALPLDGEPAGSVTPQPATGRSTNPDQDVIVDTEPSSPGSTRPSYPGTGTENSTGTRFTCEISNGQYTVMYRPESQPGRSYPWAVPSAMGGGWDSARRCNEISRRLESYRPDGLLEMQTGLENGYNTVCVTTQRIPACRIVFTVPPGQDPTSTRDRVFQNLTVADSGQQTQGVTTFTSTGQGGINGIIGQLGRWLNIGGLPGTASGRSSANGIYLRPFLDRADGGTGTYLKSGFSSQPGRRLNPGNFR